MNCPNEVADAVLEILEITIMKIRNADKDSIEQCKIEAYHVHNLPNLIKNYKPELLDYYLNIERPDFISQSINRSFTSYEPYWKILENTAKQNIKS